LNEQQTLRSPVVFRGVGLHTGQPVEVTLSPAAVESGITFLLADGIEIPALAEYVVDTSRATVLGRNGVTVSTVEHLLSALVGLGITNLVISVEGPEVPILDGSALPFVRAIREAGLLSQGLPAREFRLPELHLVEGESRLSLLPGDDFSVDVTIDFRPPIGRQHFSGTLPADRYEHEIAPARTFGYLDEVEALRARGLALGGSLENAILFGADGPLRPLRIADEPVRHKVLDLVGDFALCGAPLRGKIIAYKSGHRLHARAVQAIRQLQRCSA
jgi:UDP-3-O-[3-hydroxymyristoyl] N-acetylglucosamine deacetylase